MMLQSAWQNITTDPPNGGGGGVLSGVTWTKDSNSITAHIPYNSGYTHFAIEFGTTEGEVISTAGVYTTMDSANVTSDSTPEWQVKALNLAASTIYRVRAVVADYDWLTV